VEEQWPSRRQGDREGNQDLLTGFEAKTVIVSAGDAAIRPQAAVNVIDGDGSAVIVGRAEVGVDDTVSDPTGRRGPARRGVAELIDVAITSVYPAPQRPAKQGGGF
jgi:hypothetical protein